MKADAAFPYSRKALKALAQTLKMHRALIWLDPVTNAISLKELSLEPVQAGYASQRQNLE
jgi:hypothetical protein